MFNTVRAYLKSVIVNLGQYKPRNVRKAIVGGIAADVPLLVSDILGNHFTQGDLLGLLGAFVGAALTVFGVKNAPIVTAKVIDAAKLIGEPGPEAGTLAAGTPVVPPKV